MGDGVGKLAGFDGLWLVPTAVAAEKSFALRIEAAWRGAAEVSEVIAALAIFGLVVDDAVFHLDLAGIEVALEVGGVVLRIPQAEFDAGKSLEGGAGAAVVCDG